MPSHASTVPGARRVSGTVQHTVVTAVSTSGDGLDATVGIMRVPGRVDDPSGRVNATRHPEVYRAAHRGALRRACDGGHPAVAGLDGERAGAVRDVRGAMLPVSSRQGQVLPARWAGHEYTHRKLPALLRTCAGVLRARVRPRAILRTWPATSFRSTWTTPRKSSGTTRPARSRVIVGSPKRSGSSSPRRCRSIAATAGGSSICTTPPMTPRLLAPASLLVLEGTASLPDAGDPPERGAYRAQARAAAAHDRRRRRARAHPRRRVRLVGPWGRANEARPRYGVVHPHGADRG